MLTSLELEVQSANANGRSMSVAEVGSRDPNPAYKDHGTPHLHPIFDREASAFETTLNVNVFVVRFDSTTLGAPAALACMPTM